MSDNQKDRIRRILLETLAENMIDSVIWHDSIEHENGLRFTITRETVEPPKRIEVNDASPRVELKSKPSTPELRCKERIDTLTERISDLERHFSAVNEKWTSIEKTARHGYELAQEIASSHSVRMERTERDAKRAQETNRIDYNTLRQRVQGCEINSSLSENGVKVVADMSNAVSTLLDRVARIEKTTGDLCRKIAP